MEAQRRSSRPYTATVNLRGDVLQMTEERTLNVPAILLRTRSPTPSSVRLQRPRPPSYTADAVVLDKLDPPLSAV